MSMGKFLETVIRNTAKVWSKHSLQHDAEPFGKAGGTAYEQPAHFIRKHILFYGRVQGVGFRYYSVYKARLLNLTGWVRNVYDGSVEMEVQGDETLIEELILFLKNQKSVCIERTEIEIIPLIQEKNFRERG